MPMISIIVAFLIICLQFYCLKLSYDANDLHDLINECSINTLYKQLKDKQTDKINEIIKKSFYDNK